MRAPHANEAAPTEPPERPKARGRPAFRSSRSPSPVTGPVYIGYGSAAGCFMVSADLLAQPAAWLRCIAASYPLLAPLADWDVDARLRPVEAVRTAGSAPILLTEAMTSVTAALKR